MSKLVSPLCSLLCPCDVALFPVVTVQTVNSHPQIVFENFVLGQLLAACLLLRGVSRRFFRKPSQRRDCLFHHLQEGLDDFSEVCDFRALCVCSQKPPGDIQQILLWRVLTKLGDFLHRIFECLLHAHGSVV